MYRIAILSADCLICNCILLLYVIIILLQFYYYSSDNVSTDSLIILQSIILFIYDSHFVLINTIVI